MALLKLCNNFTPIPRKLLIVLKLWELSQIIVGYAKNKFWMQFFKDKLLKVTKLDYKVLTIKFAPEFSKSVAWHIAFTIIWIIIKYVMMSVD